MAKLFSELIEKFNPYHDRLGRFTSAGGAALVTIRTRSKLWQSANDKSISRAKQQHERTMPTAAQEKTLKGIETRTRNLKKEQLRVVDRDGNVIFTKQGDKDSVSYKIGEAREYFRGNITIHNHPEGGTFSSADLSDIGHGATEIRAAAPEGTYILRNTRTGQKWVDGQKSWYDMREDYEAAESNFRGKSLTDHIKLKREITERHTEENTRLKELADKSIAARNSGNNEDADRYYNEFTKQNEALRRTVEKEVRTYIVNQHHEWIKANAMKYGLEYEFVPVKTRTRKSFYEEETDVVMKSDGDVILDRQRNEDIKQITEEIMNSLTNEENMAKSFSELVEKFNPYHDARGRFTTSSGYASFTMRTKDPKKQHMANMAIAREKERSANPAGKYGLTKEEADELINNTSVISFKQKTDAMGWDEEKRTKFKEEFNVKEKWRERAQRKVAEEKDRQERERQELDERVKQELPGLNQESIRRANDVSFFEHGSVAARNALRRVDSYRERNKITDDMTDEQKAYMKQREEEYKQLVTEYYNDSNSRFASNPSWMVTGPANYNTRRSDKLNNAAQRKAEEYEEKLKRFEENTQRKLKSMEPEDAQIARWRQGKYKYGEKIDPADPLAEKKYQAKIDYLTEKNEKSKAANKYWNKNHDMSGFDGFSEETNQKLNSQFKRIYGDNVQNAKSPFSTDSAEIRRNKQQLEQLQNRKASASNGGGGTSFKGGQVIRNTDMNRLQIKFDEIPDAAMRQKLKSSGWRWSPKNGVWQRQLTDNAERSADSILGLSKSYYEEDNDTSFEIQKTDSDKRLVFGWANVATRANGEVIQDWQDDIVEPEDLEEAVYEYVLNFRDGGEEHQPGLRKKCRMVESVVFTEEKLEAMGIPSGTVPLGWWIGFYVDDDEAWKKVKSGHYKMFSVEGSGQRVPVGDLETRMRKGFAKSFLEVLC